MPSVYGQGVTTPQVKEGKTNILRKTRMLMIPVYLPTASPGFMVMEEVWNMAKNDLLVLSYYPSFADFKNRVSWLFQDKKIQPEYEKLSS